jgi:FkbM family methyltransferase
MTFVSYAQNCEDVLLHRVFGGQETGFYIDVGAFHPVIGSVTKTFYDRGWSGINIEPGSVFEELASARQRDINLQMAVLDRAGEIAFVEDTIDRGTSHVASDGDDKGAARMVPCDTLEGIVRTYGRGRPVDFVKVDAEGSEAAIICSTDWRRLRPRVVVIEATLPWSSTLVNQEWEPELLRQGFTRAYFDGINCFYIPEEEVPALARYFQAPVNVLDRVERHETIILRSAVDTLQQEKGRVTSQRDATQAALDTLRADYDTAKAALDDQRSAAARLTAEWDQCRGHIATIGAAKDALQAALEAQRQGLDLMTAERNHWRDEAGRLSTAAMQAQAAPPPQSAQRTGARNAVRRAALAAYKIVRPVVRPVIWRVRDFMVAGLTEQLQQSNERISHQLNERVATLSDQIATLSDQTAALSDQFSTLSIALSVAEHPAAAEMRRLSAEMETVLLTLAMERIPEHSSLPTSVRSTTDAEVSEPAITAAGTVSEGPGDQPTAGGLPL